MITGRGHCSGHRGAVEDLYGAWPYFISAFFPALQASTIAYMPLSQHFHPGLLMLYTS